MILCSSSPFVTFIPFVCNTLHLWHSKLEILYFFCKKVLKKTLFWQNIVIIVFNTTICTYVENFKFFEHTLYLRWIFFTFSMKIFTKISMYQQCTFQEGSLVETVAFELQKFVTNSTKIQKIWNDLDKMTILFFFLSKFTGKCFKLFQRVLLPRNAISS